MYFQEVTRQGRIKISFSTKFVQFRSNIVTVELFLGKFHYTNFSIDFKQLSLFFVS